MWESIRDNWVYPILVAITLGIGVLIKKIITKKNKENEDIKNLISVLQQGMCALLRSDIRKMVQEYVKKEFCDIHELETLEEAYCKYKLLGGNGFVDSLMDKARALPSEPPKEN